MIDLEIDESYQFVLRHGGAIVRGRVIRVERKGVWVQRPLCRVEALFYRFDHIKSAEKWVPVL